MNNVDIVGMVLSILFFVFFWLAVYGVMAYFGLAPVKEPKRKQEQNQELPSPPREKRTIFSESLKIIEADREHIRYVSVTLAYKSGGSIELKVPLREDTPQEPEPLPVQEAP